VESGGRGDRRRSMGEREEQGCHWVAGVGYLFEVCLDGLLSLADNFFFSSKILQHTLSKKN
jgi:hypothetical protein